MSTWPMGWRIFVSALDKADRSGGGVEMTRQKTLRCGPASRGTEKANAGYDLPARKWVHQGRRPAGVGLSGSVSYAG